MCKIVNELGMVEVDIGSDIGYGGIGHHQSVLDQIDPEESREDF